MKVEVATRRRRPRSRAGALIGSCALVVLFSVPLYTGLLGALASPAGVGDLRPWPTEFRWQNFLEVWREVSFARYILNSLFYASSACSLVLLVGVPAGYAVSRFRFPGRSAYLLAILATQMVTVSTIIIPLFLMVVRIGLFDRAITVILLSAALGTPFAVWMLSNYFDTLPPDLEEAAMVDGCSRLRALWSVLLPVARPGVAAASVLAFTMAYNQFFVPLVMLSSSERYPALVGVYTLARQVMVSWELVMAATLLVIIPPLLLFFFGQRHLVGGLTTGFDK